MATPGTPSGPSVTPAVILTALAFALVNLLAAYGLARVVAATPFTLGGEILVGLVILAALSAVGAVAQWRRYLAGRRTPR